MLAATVQARDGALAELRHAEHQPRVFVLDDHQRRALRLVGRAQRWNRALAAAEAEAVAWSQEPATS
jgi:hypothetical protein